MPTLILLVSSARKLTVLVVEACFSARPMICVCRDWIAARITVIMSRLVGSLVVAPSVRLFADCRSSIKWLIICTYSSVMMWLGWLEGRGRGGLCCLLMYSSREGKVLEPCGPGGGRGACRAAEAAAAAAGTLVDDGQEGRFFFPTRDAVREMGAGVGLLVWLRSRGLFRVREVVGTCIEGGGGRALGVVWGCVSISESKSPSRPQDVCGTFASAAHSPGGAGRIGVGDHVKGFELMGSGEFLRSCGLPGIFWQVVGTLVLSPSISGTGPQISQCRGGMKSCQQREEVYNSPEDTIDYWGELIRFCVRFGSGCIAFGGKGIQVVAWRGKKEKAIQRESNVLIYAFPAYLNPSPSSRLHIEKNRIERDRDK